MHLRDVSRPSKASGHSGVLYNLYKSKNCVHVSETHRHARRVRPRVLNSLIRYCLFIPQNNVVCKRDEGWVRSAPTIFVMESS